MKINNVSGMHGVYNQNSARKVARGQEVPRPEKSDEVVLSKEAQEVLHLQDKIAQAPDVRYERVEELRRQIEAGTYNPSAGHVADKMLRARVLDEKA